MVQGLNWGAFAIAMGTTAALIAALLPVAARVGLIDQPGDRKDHAAATPVVGGLAMLVGCIVAFLVALPTTTYMLAFMCAAALIVAIGIYDDRHDVRWYWRIGVHVLAALLIVWWGDVRIEQLGPALGLPSTGLGWLSVPFTVFATVGLINAMNMIDGSDGLAGTLALAALAMLGGSALYAGNEVLAARVVVVAGAVAGFLLWNLRLPWQRQARTFMGDAGSGFLGLVIAWVSFRLTQNPGHPVNPALALWFLPVPVMDCLVLIVRRLQAGRSPFAAGRDHIHHLMADAGFSSTRIVMVLGGFSLLCGFLAAQSQRADWVPPWVLVLAYALLCIGWYLLTRRRETAVAFFRAVSGSRQDRTDADPVEEGR